VEGCGIGPLDRRDHVGESPAMNILLVGSGGREHALAWKIKQSPLVQRLVAAPGNPGMAGLAELREVKPTDVEGLTMLAREIRADLVVIGPEVSKSTSKGVAQPAPRSRWKASKLLREALSGGRF